MPTLLDAFGIIFLVRFLATERAAVAATRRTTITTAARADIVRCDIEFERAIVREFETFNGSFHVVLITVLTRMAENYVIQVGVRSSNARER